MKNFSYARPTSIHQTIELAATSDAMILAGGTELLNWTRIGIVEPSKLVDITRVAGLEGIEQLPNGMVRIGALTKLNDVALHPLIRKSYPVLSTSILKAASAQIRNLATIGGKSRRSKGSPTAISFIPCRWPLSIMMLSSAGTAPPDRSCRR